MYFQEWGELGSIYSKHLYLDPTSENRLRALWKVRSDRISHLRYLSISKNSFWTMDRRGRRYIVQHFTRGGGHGKTGSANDCFQGQLSPSHPSADLVQLKWMTLKRRLGRQMSRATIRSRKDIQPAVGRVAIA